MTTPTPGASDAPTTPPASPAEANRPPATLPWQDAVQELMAQNLGPMQAQEVVRRACEQWARQARVNWNLHFVEMHNALRTLRSQRDALNAQLDDLNVQFAQCGLERQTLRAQLALCRAVIEEARPMVKSHLLEMERFGPGDESIIGRIEQALAGAPAADDWQPIGTAPKDGTRVLLWHSGEMEIGYWSTSLWVTRPNDSPLGKQDGAWIMHENRSDTIELTPTHWRPLPASPAVGRIEAALKGGAP